MSTPQQPQHGAILTGPPPDLPETARKVKRPINEIIMDLSAPIPDSMIKYLEKQNKKTGKVLRIPYIEWVTAARIMDAKAPGWSYDIIRMEFTTTHVTIQAQITILAEEGSICRAACGDAALDDDSFGGPVMEASAQALKRCCVMFGLGRYLYYKHE